MEPEDHPEMNQGKSIEPNLHFWGTNMLVFEFSGGVFGLQASVSVHSNSAPPVGWAPNSSLEF